MTSHVLHRHVFLPFFFLNSSIENKLICRKGEEKKLWTMNIRRRRKTNWYEGEIISNYYFVGSCVLLKYLIIKSKCQNLAL